MNFILMSFAVFAEPATRESDKTGKVVKSNEDTRKSNHFYTETYIDCEQNNQSTNFANINNLSEAVYAATSTMGSKIMDVEVNWDGEGSVRLLKDGAGNLTAVQLYYKGALMGVLTVDELNKGEKIKFHQDGIKPDPLELGLKSGTKLDPKTGGTFNFKAMMNSTGKFQDYTVTLKKVNGAWKAYRGEKAVSKCTLDPKVTMSLEWNGKFKSVSFE